MSRQSVNEIFQSYANTLYTAASRMIDKSHPQYEDKVQDLVILAYEEFLSNAEQGRIMSLPLLIHFMKLRKPEVQIEMRGYSCTHKRDVSIKEITTKEGRNCIQSTVLFPGKAKILSPIAFRTRRTLKKN